MADSTAVGLWMAGVASTGRTGTLPVGAIHCARVCTGWTLVLSDPARKCARAILARHANQTAEDFC